jgi:hypothetical protein
MFDRGAEAARRALGADAAAGYVCPLCLQPFSDIEQLSREHAPPQRVGGTVVALTCRDCNSEGGARIEHHLAAEAELASALHGDQGKEWSATVEVDGVPARAAVSFNEKGLVFTGHPQRNDPKTWGEHNDAWERLRDGGNVKFQIAFNYRQRVVEVGWLRAAYIVAFAALGYRYITQPTLDVVRRQIREPRELVLERFYSVTRDAWEGNEMIVVTTPPELCCLLVRMERRLLWLPAPDGVDTYQLLDSQPEWPPDAVNVTGTRVDWPNRLELARDFT